MSFQKKVQIGQKNSVIEIAARKRTVDEKLCLAYLRFILVYQARGPGSGCKKHLEIEGTRAYYFKTIGYCSRTKVKSPLIQRRFYATWPWGVASIFFLLSQSFRSPEGAPREGRVWLGLGLGLGQVNADL